MRSFKLYAKGYIDPVSQFEYRHITSYREAFPLLHHHDFFEFFVITAGSLKHNINDKVVILEKGNLVFIRPSDTHAFLYNDEDCQFINLAILDQTIRELFAYLGNGFNTDVVLKPDMPPTLLLTNRELNDVIARFDVLSTLPVDEKLTLNINVRFLLMNLFSRYFINRPKDGDNLPDWLSKVVYEMKKPANFIKGLKAVKDIACKSDEHLSRCFKKYLNQTPTQFVNELKLNYAANQIRFNNKKIIDIAFETGFENQSNFHRQFKQKFKCTPSDFRKLNQKDSKYDH